MPRNINLMLSLNITSIIIVGALAFSPLHSNTSMLDSSLLNPTSFSPALEICGKEEEGSNVGH